MDNNFINVRFGVRHFQVAFRPFSVSFGVNRYHVENKPEKWFEIYTLFGVHF